MDNLRKKAKELLESGDVKVVIGYADGTAGRSRAIFVTKPEDTDKLVYNENCLNNLAVYLTKHEVKHLGKIAVVATLPIMRSILQIASEKQLVDGEVIILGINAQGNYLELPDFKSIEDYIKTQSIDIKPEEKEIIAKIEAMTMEERWEFWQNEFSKCFKCYACRQTCPMCFCVRCNVENNNPQWIPVAAHKLGNMEWHVMRAMHLAGRCINCGECAKACPVDIPLNLLTYTLINQIKDEFESEAGTSADSDSVLSSFKNDDKEKAKANFIL